MTAKCDETHRHIHTHSKAQGLLRKSIDNLGVWNIHLIPHRLRAKVDSVQYHVSKPQRSAAGRPGTGRSSMGGSKLTFTRSAAATPRSRLSSMCRTSSPGRRLALLGQRRRAEAPVSHQKNCYFQFPDHTCYLAFFHFPEATIRISQQKSWKDSEE